ncbi:MAG: right-handed parallel beta-helix repeat-containing protein, partial [Acidimicrobiia bacterium]|nr:right-handed parallel beta-helix repeat-containing protein [Acidimicrobiia bacterium]
SFTDTAVTAGRVYRYEIRAQDAARNNSAPSAPLDLGLAGVGDPPLEGLDGLIVTSWGNDANADGSAARPYRTIEAAASAAPARSSVYVSTGVYRESLSFNGKSLALRAVPGAHPVLSGADRVTAWTASGARWWAQGPDFADSGWPVGLTSSARSMLVDIVAIDGVQLQQVTSSGEVGATTFWVDSANRIWIGRDPNGHVVEVARRGRGLFARNVDDFTVEGLTFRHYATGPGNGGALEIWGTRTVIRDVTVVDNANAGIRLLGSAPLIEDTRAARNGRIGALLNNADGAIVRRSAFQGNNTEAFHVFGAAGGMKTSASRDVTITGNEVNDNLGHGIWFDLSSVGVTIHANQASRNTEAGILVEVSAWAYVTDNTTLENGRGLYIVESNDVWVTGNTVGFNERNILILDSYRDGSTCTDRERGAIHVPPIDSRYGCQWPTVKWNIDNLWIAGNIVVGGRPGDFAMLEVNHVAAPEGDIAGEDRRVSAEAMHVTLGANYFERRSEGVPRWVIGWSAWPTMMTAYTDLASFMAVTGQAAGSTYVEP